MDGSISKELNCDLYSGICNFLNEPTKSIAHHKSGLTRYIHAYVFNLVTVFNFLALLVYKGWPVCPQTEGDLLLFGGNTVLLAMVIFFIHGCFVPQWQSW